MKRQELFKRFENLNLESAPTIEDQGEKKSPTRKSRSSSNSPTKMVSRNSSKPYVIPSANGPGGLLTMLRSLRQIRDQERNSVKSLDDTTDTKSNFDETFVTCRGDGQDQNNNRHEGLINEVTSQNNDIR